MKWISVKNALPAEGQSVIYYFRLTGIDIGTYHSEKCDEGGPDYQCFGGASGFLTDDVTHWMPDEGQIVSKLEIPEEFKKDKK